jgi:hypothetical protein
MKITKSPWTEECVQLLRRLRLVEGLACSEIARHLTALTGRRFSRNSVISKCDRLGFEAPSHLRGNRERQASALSNRRERPPKIAREAKPPKPFSQPRAPIAWKRSEGPARGEWNMPFSKHVDFKHCAMFIGEESGSQGLVCGKPATHGVYCEHCAAFSYQPLRLADAA